jgi:hypothetical protein
MGRGQGGATEDTVNDKYCVVFNSLKTISLTSFQIIGAVLSHLSTAGYNKCRKEEANDLAKAIGLATV